MPLKRLENAIVRRAQRSVGRLVCSITLAVATGSVVLTLVLLRLAGRLSTSEEWIVSSLMGFAVPLVAAPPVIWYLSDLVVRLDETMRELRRSARTDPLTGVANRRGFFDGLAEMEAEHPEIGVAMIDLDDFKSLNDHHGHAFGDRVLVAVGDWLRGLAGEDGLAGRLGGDEFAVVSPSADLAEIGHRRFFDLDGITVSVSIGAARITPTVDSGEALIQADGALYRAKDSRPPALPTER